jgi:hypothetical protein
MQKQLEAVGTSSKEPFKPSMHMFHRWLLQVCNSLSITARALKIEGSDHFSTLIPFPPVHSFPYSLLPLFNEVRE